jgi:hypothetical protein
VRVARESRAAGLAQLCGGHSQKKQKGEPPGSPFCIIKKTRALNIALLRLAVLLGNMVFLRFMARMLVALLPVTGMVRFCSVISGGRSVLSLRPARRRLHCQYRGRRRQQQRHD